MIAANLSKIPELNLDPAEAHKLAESMQKVAEQYDIQVAQKTLAWMDLTVTVGGIYGTRMYAYHLRKQAERTKKIGPVAVPPKQPAQQSTGA